MTPIEIYHPDKDLLQVGLHELSNLTGGRFTSFDEEKNIFDDVCKLITELHLPMDSSRIGAYRRFLQKLKEAAEKERHLTETEKIELFNTTVELSELRTIFSAATASPDSLMWQSHLKKLVAGTHPDTNSKNAPVWNFQYEMFLAAVIQLSGYEVALAEPDILVKDARRIVGIAAKRPHSLNNLSNNLKKGARQIRMSGLDGLVALDVSLIVGQNSCLIGDSHAGAIVTVKYLVDKFVKEHFADIKRACQGKHVMGALVTLNMPAATKFGDGYGQMSTAARWTVIALTENFDALQWIMEFAGKCEQGLFGRYRPTTGVNFGPR
jgi:hypothetical protein